MNDCEKKISLVFHYIFLAFSPFIKRISFPFIDFHMSFAACITFMYNKTLCCHNYYCCRSAVLFWHFSPLVTLSAYAMRVFIFVSKLTAWSFNREISCVTPKALFCLCNIEMLSSFFPFHFILAALSTVACRKSMIRDWKSSFMNVCERSVMRWDLVLLRTVSPKSECWELIFYADNEILIAEKSLANEIFIQYLFCYKMSVSPASNRGD